MKTRMVYEAFDGTPFNTEAECRAHEKRFAHGRLVGLTVDQLEAALSGVDAELADAIEVVGAKIGRDRRERGEMKRERSSKSLHGSGTPIANDEAA